MSQSTLEKYISIIEDIPDYNKLVEWINSLGKELKVDPFIRTRENYVYGCQVSTWLTCSRKNGLLTFSFDSDSNLAKGIVKILLDVINNRPADEIKKITLYDFRKIISKFPAERQRTFQYILNSAHKLTGETQ
jgi:sulfur transfer protein SufE